jgi:phosphoglycerate dehydrogenase-like enzyme
MPASLSIWCNAHFPADLLDALRQSVMPHRLILASALANNLTATGPDPALLEADIALGQPDPDSLLAAPRLQFVQLTSAGYTRYDRADLRAALQARHTALCNASAVYADPCAQHVLGMMLALARQLPSSLQTQRTDRTWPSGPVRAGQYLLTGQSALLFGYGAIARRLVELLGPFAMRLRAVRRGRRGDETVEIVGEGEVDQALGEADHIINLLPDSPTTTGYFSAARFARMKASAIFYNIGRGSTVDQVALAAALQQERLAAAYLDVATPEPLPPADPLWTTPRCYITPHSAGGHVTEFARLAEHFVANLRRYERQEPLVNRII